MNLSVSTISDIVVSLGFLIVNVVLAFMIIRFEIKEENERKENIRKMQGEM